MGDKTSLISVMLALCASCAAAQQIDPSSYLGAFWYRYSPKLDKVDDWDICRTIFADDEGNVYGSFPVAQIWSDTANLVATFDRWVTGEHFRKFGGEGILSATGRRYS